MNKISSLRAHILSIPGEIKIEPDDLATFADRGHIIATASGTNEHFQFRYQANVIITNYSGKADQLAYWLLQWLKVNQPEHQSEAVQFEADILNDQSVDLSLTLTLTEDIKVEQSAEGIKLLHADEPSVDAELLSATDWTLYVNNDEVTSWVQGG